MLSHAYFNPDTRALIMVERITRRRIDTIVMEETIGGQAQLIATLQPVNFDNPGRGYLVYGDGDQRLIDQRWILCVRCNGGRATNRMGSRRNDESPHRICEPIGRAGVNAGLKVGSGL